MKNIKKGIESLAEKRQTIQDDDMEELIIPDEVEYPSIIKQEPNIKLHDLCMEEIKRISLTSVQRNTLFEATILQRESKIWRDERTRRITASQFFKICRCRESTKENIFKQITEPPFLNIPIPAMNHGIENEKFAREKYCEISKVECQESGLIVDKIDPFLACSPDGLINLEGMI